jgi:hypothetical protein
MKLWIAGGEGGIVRVGGPTLAPRGLGARVAEATLSSFAPQSCRTLLFMGPWVRILQRGAHLFGGGGGIRTHGPRERTPVFKTGAFNRSATPPGDADCARNLPKSRRPVQPDGIRASAHQSRGFPSRVPSAIRRLLLPEAMHSTVGGTLGQLPRKTKQGPRPGPKPNALSKSQYGKGHASAG